MQKKTAVICSGISFNDREVTVGIQDLGGQRRGRLLLSVSCFRSTFTLHSKLLSTLPRLPQWRTYGECIAQLLVTTPFLAAHVKRIQAHLSVAALNLSYYLVQ